MSADNDKPVTGVIQGLILAERERCAKIVDQYLSSTGRSCAAAVLLEKIRSGE